MRITTFRDALSKSSVNYDTALFFCRLVYPSCSQRNSIKVGKYHPSLQISNHIKNELNRSLLVNDQIGFKFIANMADKQSKHIQ